MQAGEWIPISEYYESLWDSETVLLADDDGNEVVGSYGFEDEVWDGEDEFLVGAYHNDDGDLITFQPTKFKRIVG